MNPNHQVIIIGHPRCGSAYLATLFSAHAYDVRSEEWGEDGIASWTLAINPKDLQALKAAGGLRRPVGVENKYIIHHVRDPIQALPDIIEEDQNRASYDYRKKILLTKYQVNLDDYLPLDRAAISFILWNKMIAEQEPGLVIHVEDAIAPLREHARKLGWNLEKQLKGLPSYTQTKLQVDWSSLRPDLLDVLDAWCLAYKYPNLSESIMENTQVKSVSTVLGPRNRQSTPSSVQTKQSTDEPLETDADIKPRLVRNVVVQSQAKIDLTARQRSKLGRFSVRSIKK